MHESEWTISEQGFDKERIATVGNKYMIGNGYMGYRGTLEEFTKEEMTACILAGLYDQSGDKWREPVNAPNGLSTRLICDGKPIGASDCAIREHSQSLNIRNATFRRRTVFIGSGDKRISVESERFVSMANPHLIAMAFSFSCSEDCTLSVRTGIDGDVWDINGPHLEHYECFAMDEGLVMTARSQELHKQVAIAERLVWTEGEAGQEVVSSEKAIHRQLSVSCRAGVTYRFVKYVTVYTGLDDVSDVREAAITACRDAASESYESHLRRHEEQWARIWDQSDVVIEGDPEAQLALRYSIYQLLIIAPYESEKVSIPARGLSGQTYKGAVFWDTEMFMLPFFLYTQPAVARNLMMYRVHTLKGARRKAAEYGYRGAFYAWESQDTGDDACTLFNITDVFTNRPMRTYFRDKQIHINADVAYGIWQYYRFTGDLSVLLDGGAEVILECARFYYSYSYYRPDKKRYEVLDVTGPDEYHERVNNNAFTNGMVKMTLEIALQTLEVLQTQDSKRYEGLLAKLDYHSEIANLKSMNDSLYLPEPDPETLIIEQFDGYRKLEDIPLAELKSRVLNKNEYLGGGNGLATTTQILKQADVVLMLHLFGQRYGAEVKKANWDYYEPRTEHGSSLSPCVYALVAAEIGYKEWAYPYFMRTATIDLTGESKQFVGTLYIGGTHPAANGGAWMAAVLGFAGIHFNDGMVRLKPALPERWRSIRFSIEILGQKFRLSVSKNQVQIIADETNTLEQPFEIAGEAGRCRPGKELLVRYVS